MKKPTSEPESRVEIQASLEELRSTRRRRGGRFDENHLPDMNEPSSLSV